MIVNQTGRGRGTGTAGGERELTETGFKRETWKVGWTCMAGGSLSVTAEVLMTETIGKGPTKRGDNFLEAVCKGRFLEDNHTC